MKLLKDRLALAMQGPPTISAADLARACKIKPPSVSDWLSGKTKTIKGENLLAASRLLAVNAEWLASGRGPMQQSAGWVHETEAPVYVADGEIPAGYLRLPQLDLPAGAGPGVEMEAEPDVVRWIDVAEQWAEKHFNGHIPRIRVLTAKGDSMVGAGIMSGDLLFVDSGITRYDGDGYYILQFMDGWQVKRLRADVLSQQVEIVSVLASGEDAKPVPPAKLRELRIGGKVAAWWTLRKH